MKTATAVIISVSSETKQDTPPPKKRQIVMASYSETEVVRNKTSRTVGKKGVNVEKTTKGKKTGVESGE